jgi:RND family efflux transporter MFP subunit
VKLGSGILDKTIAGVRATNQQANFQLERAMKDFDRMNMLYNSGSISESVYDEHFYRLRGQEKTVESLKAQLERLELERRKMTIRAPFDGIILDKTVETGEWVPVGGTVAVIAGTSEIDAIVEVPAETLEFLERGRQVEVMGLGRKLTGRFTSFVPKGNVATRTFSAKVSLKNPGGIVEGMEARVFLPTGGSSEGLLVSRDAVINKMGMDVVYIDNDGSAKKVPVKVLGYKGMKASITGPGLSAGMKAIVKGNERIMFDGQPLKTVESAGDDSETKATDGVVQSITKGNK